MHTGVDRVPSTGTTHEGPPAYDEIDVIHAYAEEDYTPVPRAHQRFPARRNSALNQPVIAPHPTEHGAPYRVSYQVDDADETVNPTYPLQNDITAFTSNSALHIPLTELDQSSFRDEYPGIYTEAAPDMALLNEEQRKIAKEYPRDLDDEPRSLVQTIVHGFVHWRDFCKWRYLHYYLIGIAIIVLIVLMTVFHEQIIDWLEPTSQKVRTVWWGWVIPVAVLFVLSFPPLFGAEIIAVLCGIVYGVWIGFGIVALGTLLGEIGNYYLFKYTLQKLARKTERKSMTYAALASIIRNGGFRILLALRLSAMPGHIITAVCATVGVGFWLFVITAVLSLPKYLGVVYFGVAIRSSDDKSSGSRVVQLVVIIAIAVITMVIALYIWRKMDKVKPAVRDELRRERYARLIAASKPDDTPWQAGMSNISLPDTHALKNEPIPLHQL
ncbi:hypothetical protein MCUN1_000072 [Malassezia cuniculi]|uniref:Golgi apparatus membrane protein TVP38 n=1 Tax=Malassezia cuniculi TaxID=948313 RepID=A0AAF0EQA1_9BASI|nr:hypothetical protein MCUN1_000072 [Malassezia cuniculi]